MTWLDDRAVRGLRDFAGGIGPGDVVDDRYELGQRIGEGGMSTVYAALDRETGDEVAIKVIAAYGDHDDARFEREVEALRRAAHVGVVGVLAHGVFRGERYVVTPRLVGCTLAERLTRGPLPLAATLVLGKRLADALEAVHGGGVIHRDIKPSNVFLAHESVDDVRLLDFGLARTAGSTTLTSKGALLGTPGYMAPEQIRREDGVSAKADVFALGCVLWEALAGRPLYAADGEETLFAKILLEPAPPIATVASDVPPMLGGLLAAMLEKDPSARPSAAEVARALANLLSELGSTAAHESAGSRDDETAPEIAPGVEVGTVIGGKYRVEHVLGRGGMGVVVSARHLELGTSMALKLLRSGSSTDHARFLREARAASRLESEHVARVLDVGRSDATPFIVMEQLNGVDLGARLAKDGPVPEAHAVGYVLQACEAIAEAHALGIIHRDLKPSNLFLSKRRDGSEIVKVLDFGISKLTDPADGAPDVTLTDGNAVIGSIPYMSPEQLIASARVDPRTDIWSLGVVLHELVTGTRPFDGENATAIVARIAAAAPVRLRDARAGASPVLESIVLTCLAKDPGARFPNVAELARALLPLAPREAHASVERATRLVGAVGASPEPPRRRRWALAMASVSVLATAGLVVGLRPARTTPSHESVPPSRSESSSAPVVPASSPSMARAEEPATSTAPTTPVRRTTPTARPSTRPTESRPSSLPPARSGEIDLRDPALERR